MASGDRIYLGERDSFTAAELITTPKYKVETVTIPSVTSNSTLFSITGSGLLYLAIMSFDSASMYTNTIYSTVSVDDIVLMNKQIINPYASDSTGIVTPDGMLYSPKYTSLIGPGDTGAITFESSNSFKAPSSTLDTTANLIYIPKPIRFNNGFKVVGRTTGATAKFTCVYELD